MLQGKPQGAAEKDTAIRPEPRRSVENSLIGIYEISKVLTAPARLETTLYNVLNLLSSFLDMGHGTIMLLGDDYVPEISVGGNWTCAAGARARFTPPRRALDQVVATAMPLVVQNAANHPLFQGDPLAEQAPEGKFTAFLGVPIKIDAKVAGTLSIDLTWDGSRLTEFDHHVRFLTMVANLTGQTVKLHKVIARDRERLMEETRRLEKQLDSERTSAQSRPKVRGIVGESPLIRDLLDKIAIVAKSNITVLLRGESGTGKELFARAIHEMSPRAGGPFVRVNCAALPESVLESELFGHEKGAFTGAHNARKGRFEMAHGGTIFLDEIGEISGSFQAKLLRVLQEGEFDRVGSSRTQKVNVRVVTATNRNLEEAVARGEFRADLYYRISVVPLLLPPLRARKSDVPLLAQTFLERFNKENGRDLRLSPEALAVLDACSFPGNVRELENCIYRTATLARGSVIGASDFACKQGDCLSATLCMVEKAARSGAFGVPPLPSAGTTTAPAVFSAAAPPVPPASPVVPPARPENAVPLAVLPSSSQPQERSGCDRPQCPAKPARDGQEARASAPEAAMSRERLIEAMERSGWVQAKAARLLGLTPRQISYALRKHNIGIKKF